MIDQKSTEELMVQQNSFFRSGKTQSVEFRIAQLKKLVSILKANESLLFESIDKDFKKSLYDTFATELALIYKDIQQQISNVRKWSKRKRVKTNLINFPAKSYIYPEPLGTVLIIGAWNYPFLLSFGPAIAAIGAGNTVVLKPSEVPQNSSRAMAQLINENFPKEFFHVVEGGVEITTDLLTQKWNKIFFTGSTQVGKIVYQAAAKNLVPVTLELGGKSPAFITKDADLKIATRRIVWGKFLNAGQTCIAPDYLLVDTTIYDTFLEELKNRIVEIDYSIEKGNYTQIINDKNYARLQNLIDEDKIYYSESHNEAERIFSPMILKNVQFSDAVMQEEIFGPILPVMSYSDIDEAIQKVKELPQPLSCYVFTKDTNVKTKIIQNISFGGGAINDVVMHISNPNLPFGGIGNSGIGNYHGKAGFDTFTHYKSVLDKPTWIDPSIRYNAYDDKKLKLLGWMFRR